MRKTNDSKRRASNSIILTMAFFVVGALIVGSGNFYKTDPLIRINRKWIPMDLR